MFYHTGHQLSTIEEKDSSCCTDDESITPFGSNLSLMAFQASQELPLTSVEAETTPALQNEVTGERNETMVAPLKLEGLESLEKPGSSQEPTVTSDSDTEEPSCIVQVVPEADLQYCPRILTRDMMQQIHDHLPESLSMHQWDRCFAIGRDGDSFVTLLDYCAPHRYTVTIIRSVDGYVMGGFCSVPWKSKNTTRGYYGSGQSFLFASHPMGILEEGLHFYPWTGRNNYCQICDIEKQVLCMGGEGDFGWIVKENFEQGQTGHCQTFDNPPLAPAAFFRVADLEVYGLKPFGCTVETSSKSRQWRY